MRLGYRPTPLWSRFIGRYNLLCDNCNWEFVGFAVPGTINLKKKKKKNTDAADTGAENGDAVAISTGQKDAPAEPGKEKRASKSSRAAMF